MNGALLVQVSSTSSRNPSEIQREIDEHMAVVTSLIREKVIAQLNLRVVGVEDVEPISVPSIVDAAVQPSTKSEAA